jgi:hypothetical protein
MVYQDDETSAWETLHAEVKKTGGDAEQMFRELKLTATEMEELVSDTALTSADWSKNGLNILSQLSAYSPSSFCFKYKITAIGEFTTQTAQTSTRKKKRHL